LTNSRPSNKELETAGEKAFPNARNATAGALKQLDPQARRPTPDPRGVLRRRRGGWHRVQDALRNARNAGEVRSCPRKNCWWVCDGIEEVLKVYREKIVAHYDEDKDLRRQLPYEIDGIVHQGQYARRLGANSRTQPRAGLRHRPQARAVDHAGGNSV
jgi:NAD-dependent DNA ligase